MLCSNCKVIEIRFEANVPATCQNGHFLCGKCMLRANDKCLVCDGQMLNSDEQTWSYEAPNTMSKMDSERWNHYLLTNKLSTENYSGDACALSENCNAASMNLLYSRDKAYPEDDSQHSSSVNPLDSKWNSALAFKNLHPKVYDHRTDGSKDNAPSSNHDRNRLLRKDTRQNLVEQTKEAIRTQIIEEISKSFEYSPRTNKAEEYTRIKQFQTIGVSTESTPKLLPEERISTCSLERSKESIVNVTRTEQSLFEIEPQKFLVLNVDVSNIPNPRISIDFEKKKNSSCIDLRLQQIMATILESVTEKPPVMTEDQHFYRFLREKFSHLPLTKLEEIISSIHSEGDKSNSVQVCPPFQNDSLPDRSTDLSLISNSRRAFYNPPIAKRTETAPDPQFQVISFCNLISCSDLQQTEIIDAATLNIPRSPVICPISNCQRAFFVSDFTKHIAVDHTKVPMERIFPRLCKNFFVDPRLIHVGIRRCQVLLLVKDKIRNLGHEKFKNFIPILVMTTKVSLLELCSNQFRAHSEEVKNSMQNFIMIWLTGIMPPQLPIFFSLTVWARSGYMPTCHIVHSGRLYSVRNSQSPEAVQESGQMLLLSENQVDLLTNRGRHMLELQIVVH